MRAAEEDKARVRTLESKTTEQRVDSAHSSSDLCASCVLKFPLCLGVGEGKEELFTLN